MNLFRLVIFLWIIPISLIYLHTTNSFDQDLGRHIKLGEIIWETKEIPKTNLFSYTHPDEPVFNSHWGSQVIFYLVHRSLGVGGLIVLNTIINTLVFGLVFAFAVRRVGILIPSALFIPFSYLLLDRIWIRPEMFGNLFFSILLISLFVQKIRKIIKWLMPVIAIVWVNTHVTFTFGLLVMFTVLVQDVVEVRDKKKQALKNAGLFTLTFLATFVNPYGLGAILSAFTILLKYGYAIVENQSWFFLKDFGFPLVKHIFFGFIIVIMSYLSLILNRRKVLIGEIIILIVISILTLRFVRNEILFAYSAFLISCLNFKQLKPFIKLRFSQSHSLLLSMVFLLFGSYLIINSHTSRGLPVGIGSIESYKKGVDFFLKNNLAGPIFNNFDIGGYLIYRLYPKERVFVDNRPEAYPVSFFQEMYIPMQINQPTFKKFSDQYGIQSIIWGRRDITPWSRDFLNFISKDEKWKILYIDDATIIFQKMTE